MKAKVLDLDAKRSAPVDRLSSWPGVPSSSPLSPSPQIGQSGLNVTGASSLKSWKDLSKGFQEIDR